MITITGTGINYKPLYVGNEIVLTKVGAGALVGAGLIAPAESFLPLIVENYWDFKNWRRPDNCSCKGCHAWKTLPKFLHEVSDISCRNAFLAWENYMPNLVTTEGKNDLLTQYFKGSSYSATWYVGLVNNAGFTAYAAGDTAAQIGGTNGWAEGVPYSNANRVTWTGGSVSGGSVDNSGSVAAFNINATQTVRGAFLISNNTKSGTTGKLYGEADFSVARSVLSGDTLNVTVTLTAS